mgnify:CR=1 FL=1
MFLKDFQLNFGYKKKRQSHRQSEKYQYRFSFHFSEKPAARKDTVTVGRFEVQLSYFPPEYAENLCQNLRALAHE